MELQINPAGRINYVIHPLSRPYPQQCEWGKPHPPSWQLRTRKCTEEWKQDKRVGKVAMHSHRAWCHWEKVKKKFKTPSSLSKTSPSAPSPSSPTFSVGAAAGPEPYFYGSRQSDGVWISLQVKQELGAHTREDILRKQVCNLKEAGAVALWEPYRESLQRKVLLIQKKRRNGELKKNYACLCERETCVCTCWMRACVCEATGAGSLRWWLFFYERHGNALPREGHQALPKSSRGSEWEWRKEGGEGGITRKDRKSVV